ncbi:AAA family ATPase [Tenacibaculum finnmarkense]|uniref:AAA family ATPase n=1 Tax=Tenacibaculum finnmarkense TaxID=2781243 RepID=UPI000C5900E1|nr:AAA family ATPase [Tenacibaculum finnmarkense]MCD8439083.1 AAA family ATPase [Tenacibaculum finnmarkense genomovar ulcerans]MCG8719767.1 AAA family ATPase [Tenacibaculum finnmarkense]SOS54809.1 AAA domain-containing protein [Tenacibaculum finnmarkense]
MANEKIKTTIECQNIAPIPNLSRSFSSKSLKTGVFANNGSGKTFISRLFRLTENKNQLLLENEISPTDKLIAIGESSSSFSFSIIDKEGITKEDFKIQLNKGVIPVIPKTKYIYHTFNQDYVEENISALSYEKDSEIEGYIIGKINIDLKEDEEKLSKIKKENVELNEQIEIEVEKYIDKNISNINNIKRLGDYKILEFQNIFNGIQKNKYSIAKTFDELIDDYNKIKSVPENLDDIKEIEKLKFDLNLLNEIKENCFKEYSLSLLATEFKDKIKSKQLFIETGISLINSEKKDCPFCEQTLEKDALNLIDNYTTYLNDVEANTIKQFKNYETTLREYLISITKIEIQNTKRINEFNKYKTKYIPSSEDIELNSLNIKSLKKQIEHIIESVQNKIKDLNKSIDLTDEQLLSLEKTETLFNAILSSNNEEIEAINKKKNKIGEENKLIRKLIIKCAYNHLIDEHKNNIESVIKLRDKWKYLNDEITKKREQQKVSKKEKVASTIKIVLNHFFAEKYTLDEENFRLIFHKNTLEKKQAKNILSEGEKNIVAFAYFIGDTHLKIEKEDDYQKLFFVIDDPISSMDFSHVYTMSGVIRNIGKIIGKIKYEKFLILTHSNDFMRVLASNNIIDKKLLLKKGQLIDFNNNLTVPYINHLTDIYEICRKNSIPTHTTANSIRHIVETLTKFENIIDSRESIADYIKKHIPNDIKSFTLINDLSYGGWRTEQAPITDDDYTEICETIVKHIETKYIGQIDYCKKICQ